MCRQNVTPVTRSTDRHARSGLLLVESIRFRCIASRQKITVRTRLGFIGLGFMGSRIAQRLVAAGFPMVVYKRDGTKAVEFADLGAEVA
jgi:phosphoglycerate dehydrogenase-like enzyme